MRIANETRLKLGDAVSVGCYIAKARGLWRAITCAMGSRQHPLGCHKHARTLYGPIIVQRDSGHETGKCPIWPTTWARCNSHEVILTGFSAHSPAAQSVQRRDTDFRDRRDRRRACKSCSGPHAFNCSVARNAREPGANSDVFLLLWQSFPKSGVGLGRPIVTRSGRKQNVGGLRLRVCWIGF